MHDDRPTRHEALAADGLPPPEILDAWEVPDPSPDAIDRMFAAEPHEERAMHTNATPTHAPRRSLLTPVAIGFLVAASLLLSFWIGRRSVEPRVVETAAVVATPDVAVGEPSMITPLRGSSIAATCPEVAPAPPAPVCPVLEQVPIPVCAVGPQDASKPSRPRAAPRSPASSHSPDLKNPFAVAEPQAKTARLHIGTNKGVPPAHVWIDGRKVGKTPLPNVKVTPGPHTVRFVWPNGKEVTRRIDVEDGVSEVIRAG